jgi:hypothetical protein
MKEAEVAIRRCIFFAVQVLFSAEGKTMRRFVVVVPEKVMRLFQHNGIQHQHSK